jgi:hydrogenase nickel incorporation protein HypA/HybF
MHEVGIAASIIEIAEGVARERGNVSIRAIGLQLGAFTGVVREALEFSFEALRSGTLAAEARLEIREIPLIGECPQCRWTGPPTEDFCLICPRCQTPVNIVSGREMQLEYVDLEGVEIYGTSQPGDQSSAQERRVCGGQSTAV